MLAVLMILALCLVPATAIASTVADIVVTVTAAIDSQCPTDFEIVVTASEDLEIYYVQISWTPAVTGNGTIIVANVGEYPESCSDGLIYEGNGTSTTHVITDVDDMVEGLYYRAYTRIGENCSACYVSGSVVATLQDEPAGIGNVTIDTSGISMSISSLVDYLKVALIFGFPLLLGLIGVKRHGLALYLCGVIGLGVSLSLVGDSLGAPVTIPTFILIVGLIGALVRDGLNRNLIII